MNRRSKLGAYIKQYAQYLVVWSFAMTLYNVIRRVGTLDAWRGEILPTLSLSETIKFTIPLVFIMALLTIITQYILSARRTMQMSFGKIIGLTILLDVTIIIVVILIAYQATIRIGFRDMVATEAIYLEMFRKNMLTAGVYITIVNLLINITRLINTALGKGNLWKLLSGKYHDPQEEEFIFLFLDLQSSTTAAEKLGHLKYSRMLQECFYDLTLPLQKFEGNIYQYVGDEAVIMWKPNKGLVNANCLQLYFEFERILRRKRAHFLEKFEWYPEFKAGIHMGPTIATQVGYVKREIAFHGDTLNTAARILSLCNAKGVKILLSEFLKDRLISRMSDISDFRFIDRGKEILKGKEELVRLYEVEMVRTDDVDS